MELLYVATFVVTFIASILSGIAGGGVSFITTPFWLILGMSPAQGGATGAFMATGMSISSVAAFKKSGHLPKDKTLFLSLAVVTCIASVVGVLVVPKIDIEVFKNLLGIVTILTLPLLFVKPSAKFDLGKHRTIGFVLAAVFMTIGSIIISSAFSMLFTLTLIAFYGMSVMQTTAMKRLLFSVQSVVLLAGFALQGFLIWQYAVAGFLGGVLGAHIGTRYALKKGEVFAKYALATMSLVGAIVLLV